MSEDKKTNKKVKKAKKGGVVVIGSGNVARGGHITIIGDGNVVQGGSR